MKEKKKKRPKSRNRGKGGVRVEWSAVEKREKERRRTRFANKKKKGERTFFVFSNPKIFSRGEERGDSAQSHPPSKCECECGRRTSVRCESMLCVAMGGQRHTPTTHMHTHTHSLTHHIYPTIHTPLSHPHSHSLLLPTLTSQT